MKFYVSKITFGIIQKLNKFTLNYIKYFGFWKIQEIVVKFKKFCNG